MCKCIIIFVFSLLILNFNGNADVNNSQNQTIVQENVRLPPQPSQIQTHIQINDTSNLPVKEATIEIVANGSILYSLYSNENGISSFSGEQNRTYTFIIKAESYEDLSENITLLPAENKIKFTLRPIKNQKDYDSWLIFIPATLGFLVFIYWVIRFYDSFPQSPEEKKSTGKTAEMTYSKFYLILSILILLIGYSIFFYFIKKPFWLIFITVFVLLIAYCIFYQKKIEEIVRNILFIIALSSWPAVIVYSFLERKENIFLPGDTRFSVYIPLFALIGILSYLLISINEIFEQAMPKYKKKSIVWVYIRRVTIAPYIAILAVFILLNVAQMQNFWFVILFSFFTGMFTKTIEEWLYRSVKKLLPEDLIKEIQEREKYKIENLELVVKLNVDKDIAFELYKNNIKTVEQLAYTELNVDGLTFKDGITEKYFDMIRKKARNQIAEVNQTKEFLNLTPNEMDLMVNKAKVFSVADFAGMDVDSVNWEINVPAENAKLITSFKQKQIKAKAIVRSKDLKLLSIDDIEKLCTLCKTKPDEFRDIVTLHSDIIKTGISGWNVGDTVELYESKIEIKIRKLKDLKNLCESGHENEVLEATKQIQRMSELIDLLSFWEN